MGGQSIKEQGNLKIDIIGILCCNLLVEVSFASGGFALTRIGGVWAWALRVGLSSYKDLVGAF